MKNLCRKGRVHPSAATCKDFYAVLRLLPVAAAALRPEDQEVLAYLIARSPDVPQQIDIKKHRKLRKNAEPDHEKAFLASSFKTFAETEAMLRRSPSGRHKNSPKNSNNSAAVSVSNSNDNTLRTHPASFECSCFQCYMSFWSRWDESPSREAIGLFEDLMAAESSSAKNNKHRKGFKKEEKIDEVVIPQGIINNNNNFVGDSDLKVDDEATPAVSKSTVKAKQIVPLTFDVEEDDDTEETGQTVTEQVGFSRAGAGAGAGPLGGRSPM